MINRIHVDIPRAIAESQAAMKSFELKNKFYRILYRGKGLEFDSFRDYSPDDDAQTIDWKASLRGNKLLVRKYIEERDIKIIFALDVSDRMVFGSGSQLKCEYSAEMIAALSYFIMGFGDYVGVILFSDHVIDFIPPRKSEIQFDLIVDQITRADRYGGNTSFGQLFRFILEHFDSSINSVFICSDFLTLTPHEARDLALISTRHETIALMVRDVLDSTLPPLNKEVMVEDPISKTQLVFNPKLYRDLYESYTTQKERETRLLFQRHNVDLLSLYTDVPFFTPLAQFLKERVNKRSLVH